MSEMETSSPEFFDAKYRSDDDPWSFASSPYELQRYDAIVAALSSRRYRLALEPGCSIGVLSRRLATLCDTLEASDFSPTAAARARASCADLPNVRVSCQSLADLATSEDVDLLVLSEIGYYFVAADLAANVTRLVTPLRSGAVVLGCHWLGTSPDHQINGQDVHDVLNAEPLLRREHTEEHQSFRLDRWIRR